MTGKKNTSVIFKALSDELRIRIINLFIRSRRSLCVCELMDALKTPQYKVSKALLFLTAAGFFTYEKKGLWVYYKLNNDSHEYSEMLDFLNSFLKNIFKEDERRLDERLLLRENDSCVVGILQEKELTEAIMAKKEKMAI